MQLHQFVHTLNYGDAISGEALSIQRALAARGVESRIYSVHTHEKLEGATVDFRRFSEDCGQAALRGEKLGVILHYSIASPLNRLFLEQPGIARAMIFHNLTPVHWFCRYNARVADDLRQGFAELPVIARASDVVLADSEFNRRELTALGCDPIDVLPLTLDRSFWDRPANPGIAGIMRGHGGRNILHVGRIAPNKRLEDIIKAFYFYHHKIDRKSRLWFIGTDIDTEIYSFELRRLISEFRLREAVFFVGAVSNEELRAFYEGADLYLCLSEHEGFCMPLLEAMHFGVPIIAYDAGAVAETLGEGGVLLGRKSPAELAELMHYVLTEPGIKPQLIEKGRERVRDFCIERFEQNLEQHLTRPLFELLQEQQGPQAA